MVAMPVITLGGRFLLLHVVFPYVNNYCIPPILQTFLNFANLNPPSEFFVLLNFLFLQCMNVAAMLYMYSHIIITINVNTS